MNADAQKKTGIISGPMHGLYYAVCKCGHEMDVLMEDNDEGASVYWCPACGRILFPARRIDPSDYDEWDAPESVTRDANSGEEQDNE